MIRVELIRAWPQRFESATVELDDGSCVAEALAKAGWALDAEFVGLAVFGRAVEPQATLQAGDRIELLRALILEPMQARRQRAGRRR